MADAETEIVAEKSLPDLVRLRKVEDAARRLWPYVRFFGLCGADPDAIKAVVDLSIALGISGDERERGQSVAVVEAAEKVAAATAEAVAKDCTTWLAEHRFCGHKMRRDDWGKLVDEFKARWLGEGK